MGNGKLSAFSFSWDLDFFSIVLDLSNVRANREYRTHIIYDNRNRQGKVHFMVHVWIKVSVLVFCIYIHTSFTVLFLCVFTLSSYYSLSPFDMYHSISQTQASFTSQIFHSIIRLKNTHVSILYTQLNYYMYLISHYYQKYNKKKEENFG